jgi:hypothetical protein
MNQVYERLASQLPVSHGGRVQDSSIAHSKPVAIEHIAAFQREAAFDLFD